MIVIRMRYVEPQTAVVYDTYLICLVPYGTGEGTPSGR